MIPEFEITDSIKNQYSHTVWDEGSGLCPAELEGDCRCIAEDYSESFAETKAKMMAYILDHARLEKNPNDIFPDKLCHGNVVGTIYQQRSEAIVSHEMRSQLDAIGAFPFEGAYMARKGAYVVSTDFGHLAPDWEFVIQAGIPGVIHALEKTAAEQKDTDRCAFYEQSLLVWHAFQRFVLRLAAHKQKEGSLFSADNLRYIANNAPKTLAQAMQLTLLIYRFECDVEGAIVRSLGRLDRMYEPHYQHDLQSGEYSEKDLRNLMRHFLYKLSAMNVTANVPIAICGTDPETDADCTNDLTKMMLEEYDSLHLYDPKFHVFWHDGIRPDVCGKILDMVLRGHNSFVFMNGEVVAKSLVHIGIKPEDAKNYAVYGCYEAAAAGKEIPASCGGRINLPKAIEWTLAEHSESWDGFLENLKKHLKYMMEECMQTIAMWEPYYDRLCPAPMLSATFENCRKLGLDAFCGGVEYNNTSIVAAGIGSLVDMALAVKMAVFEEKRTTFAELRQALEQDWVGHDALRHYCIYSCPKYGCGNPEADGLVSELTQFISSTINGRPNGRGGVFRCGMFSIDWRIPFGKRVGATPDGRRAGEALSKNLSACVGKDVNGVTALICSASKINQTHIPDGAVLDLVLHPSSLNGEEGLLALHALIASYFRMGGFSVHINVMDADTLRRAKANPKEYQNLQVRLCGWNVRFVDLSAVEQDDFIRQAEMVG